MKQSLVNIVACGLLIRNLWLHWAHPVIHVTLHHKILNSVSPTGFRDLTRMLRVQLLSWPHPVSTDGARMSRWLAEGVADVLLFGFWYRPPLMDGLCEANGTFAISLLKMLGEEDHLWNVFSPLNLSSVLTVVLMGTEGTQRPRCPRCGGFLCVLIELICSYLISADGSQWGREMGEAPKWHRECRPESGKENCVRRNLLLEIMVYTECYLLHLW